MILTNIVEFFILVVIRSLIISHRIRNCGIFGYIVIFTFGIGATLYTFTLLFTIAEAVHVVLESHIERLIQVIIDLIRFLLMAHPQVARVAVLGVGLRSTRWKRLIREDDRFLHQVEVVDHRELAHLVFVPLEHYLGVIAGLKIATLGHQFIPWHFVA